MARNQRDGASNRGLAAAFAALLVVVVGVRLAVVWLSDTTGTARLLVSIGLVVVFVGIPAAYGVRGLLRDDGDDRDG